MFSYTVDVNTNFPIGKQAGSPEGQLPGHRGPPAGASRAASLPAGPFQGLPFLSSLLCFCANQAGTDACLSNEVISETLPINLALARDHSNFLVTKLPTPRG